MEGEVAKNTRSRLILAVLFAVSILNFVDRQILAILAGKVKADLLISDAQIGFLYGTVFGIFYAVFGVPLGIYADLGSRRKLIASGLALWSLMTAASGLATGFSSLALARVGVGVGEASASPAAYSLLADLFPRARRGTALGIYSLGIYVGIGLSSYLGGTVVDAWSAAFLPGQEPFGLRGWQAAFLIAGLPGLLLVPLVLSFREPERGAQEEIPATPPVGGSSALRSALREGLALMPPFSLFVLRRDSVPAAQNAGAFAACLAGAASLSLAFGDPIQWTCVAVGLYVVVTLAQRLRVREPDAFALIFETPSLRLAALGFSFLSFTGYAVSLWTAQFFIRYHGYSASEIGARLGLISALGGGLGVTVGGILADRLRRRTPSGRLIVGMMNALIPIPLLLLALTVADRDLALWLFALAQVFAALWLGAGSSTVQDLVLPHMRARASAVFLLFVTIIGLTLGPYVVGRLSDLWGSLRLAFMAATLSNVVAFALFVLAARTIAVDEETRLTRATAARA
ncbi:MAG: MFS transporter [Vicinamibacteria bacterium]|nr:MFS transporter [Vicinamibacteria bacterium]